MQSKPWQRALVVLISFCFLATSCTTTRVTRFPNEDTPNATPAVTVGDTVRVTLRSGGIKTFEVTAIETDGLTGKKLSVPYKDMAFLEVRKISAWRSVGLGLGLVLAAAGALFLYLISSIDDEE